MYHAELECQSRFSCHCRVSWPEEKDKSLNLTSVFPSVSRHNITTLGLVPTMALQIISAADRLENVDLSSLSSVFVGSSAINPIQKQRLFELLTSRGALTGQQDGSSIIDGYGMSEVFNLVLILELISFQSLTHSSFKNGQTTSAITTWSKDGR
jgi:acyl-coenzyme A synthetase/AMP-(fatty) acid ligase